MELISEGERARKPAAYTGRNLVRRDGRAVLNEQIAGAASLGVAENDAADGE